MGVGSADPRGRHTHLEKVGTPTMGGIVMLVALVVAYLATRPTIAAGITFSPAGLADPRGGRVRVRRVRRRLPEGPASAVPRSVEGAEVHRDRRGVGAVLLARGGLLRGHRHVDEPLLRPADSPRSRRLPLLRLGLRHPDVLVARREPDRRARRPRGRLIDPRPRGIRVHRVLAVPASATRSCRQGLRNCRRRR